MRRHIFILLLLLHSVMLYPSVFTTIKGSIQGANGYGIRLYTYSDQITFIEKKLASATIDDQGRFNLITELSQITYAFLSIGNIRADIILQPGKAYEILISDYPPESWLETRNLILQREKLNYSFLLEPEGDINGIINLADSMYNRFLARHYMDIYKKRTELIDAFIDTFFLQFGGYTHPWIREMVDCRIASLKLAGYKVPVEIAHVLWLQDHDLEYNHPDFMELFNQIFDNYLTTRFKHYSYDELLQTINHVGSFFALSEMMGRDTVLRNEQLREMVMIKSLGEIYHHRDFKQGNIIRILSYIATSSKFREHRIIASNLIFISTRFDKGMMAPDFSLADQNGGMHSIQRYQGKYLYLAFFTSNCIPCLAEFKYLASIYPSLINNLEVLAVSLDPNPQKMWKVMDQQKYPWPVVHFGNDYELTDRYNIRSCPFFILIAPDGSFDTYGARQPSSQFKAWFEEVVLKQK